MLLESSRQSAQVQKPSATIILVFRALSARTTKLLARYQYCHMTYQLLVSSMNLELPDNRFRNWISDWSASCKKVEEILS